jgi:hypothetical protein
MIDHLVTHAVVLAHCLTSGVRSRIRRRGSGDDRAGEAGVSTLEMVIIALGLMAVAALLVAAITAAVNRRTSQIK